MRYVQPLLDTQRDLLEHTMTHDAAPRARARAHSLLLSADGMTIKDITKIYPVDRDTVSTWIRKWEHEGPASLHDKPRSGRPPKLTPDEQTLALAYIKEEPRSLTQVVERLTNKTEKPAIPAARIKVLCDPIISSVRQPVGCLYPAFEALF